MNIQWYPGHMTKARRAMQEDVRLVDLLIEVVDARVPVSSRNPDIETLGAGKARLILLNKADLADEAGNEAWERYFTAQGDAVVRADSRSSAQLKKVNAAVQEACRDKISRDRMRGIVNRPIRAMVVGIPNVGKSTFINSFAGKACVKTGNRPGVTKGNQWIRLNKSLEMLDTPGLLWPKFEDPAVGLHLAMIGSINDQILNKEELALELIRFMEENCCGALGKRYGFPEEADVRPDNPKEPPAEAVEALPDGCSPDMQILRQAALRRGCLLKGGSPDYEKAAGLLLEDFRAGRLGRITLEWPPR